MSEYIPACATCKYAVQREGDADMECHRLPIQVAGIDADGDIVSCFPATELAEWCGEYVQRWGI